MAAWTVLAAITLFGPPLLLNFPALVTGIGGVSGLMALLLGQSSLTSATGQQRSSTPSGARNLLKGLRRTRWLQPPLCSFLFF